MLFKNREQIINNGETTELKKAREDILELLSAAIKSVDPYNAVISKFEKNQIIFKNKKINLKKFNDIYLAGFGKASIEMTKAVCDSVNVKQGIVITNDSLESLDYKNIELIIGSHPIPDQNSLKGAEKVINLIKKCKKDDFLIVLISGGGSALLEKPRVSLEDLQKTTDLLLKSGANINEINTIRKHLSYIKGGQLIKYAKCRVFSFIISDIINDPIEFIASGPTYPDSTTFYEAEKILFKYKLTEKIPKSVIKIFEDGKKGIITETPKPNNKIFNRVQNLIVANNEIACKAAEIKAQELGYKTLFLTSSIEGEAKKIGKFLIKKVMNYMENEKIAFISGGETTVTIEGSGRGGRNQEMVLSTVELLKNRDIVFSSFATDGVDGPTDAAGALADGFTSKKARKQGLDILEFLENNNSYEFFERLDSLLITDKTGTNVMDIQIILKIR